MVALQFGTHDPQVVHVFAAHGSETCDDHAARTLDLGGSPARMRPRDRLGRLGPGIVAPLGDLPYITTFADSFIHGSTGSSS